MVTWSVLRAVRRAGIAELVGGLSAAAAVRLLFRRRVLDGRCSFCHRVRSHRIRRCVVVGPAWRRGCRRGSSQPSRRHVGTPGFLGIVPVPHRASRTHASTASAASTIAARVDHSDFWHVLSAVAISPACGSEPPRSRCCVDGGSPQRMPPRGDMAQARGRTRRDRCVDAGQPRWPPFVTLAQSCRQPSSFSRKRHRPIRSDLR